MIYGIEVNQYDKISENVDVPEAKRILARYFELDLNDDEKIGEKLIGYFKAHFEKIFHLLITTSIGYTTLIMLSRNLNPEFWTSRNVVSIKNRHKILFKTFNNRGEFNFELSEAKETKNILLRYFDLLPEEEDHNDELIRELINAIKGDEDFKELLKFTEINPIFLIYVIEDLDPKFFNTGRGKQIKNRITQRVLL